MDADTKCWYLYGITHEVPVFLPKMLQIFQDAARTPVEIFTEGSLAALVRPVSLAEFGPVALAQHIQQQEWLEEQVRHHAAVLATIATTYPVLPAKFGCVYPSDIVLRASLRADSERFLTQLNKVEGCDEWEMRIIVNRQHLRQHIMYTSGALQDLQQQIATASPGRAYLLQRRFQNAVEAAIDQHLESLQETCSAYLNQCTVENQMTGGDQKEMIRFCVLILRRKAEDFFAAWKQLIARYPALQCEYSGPWPPYSFAIPLEERVG